jgi:glycosyltransferase involved in cell wall biosynthesis
MLLGGRDFPPDIRVEKEARALRAAGHHVTIVCEQRTDRPREDTWEGSRVIRLPASPGSDLARNLVFRDPRFRRVVDSIPADALHVHDLPLAGTALAVGRRRGLPVVADFHENFPASVRTFREELPPSRARLLDVVSSARRWESYERRAARAASRVLVVVDEAKERLVLAGVPADRIAVVENTEDVARFTAIPVQPVAELADVPNAFVLLYAGGFGGRHRGLDTAIDAMPAILAALPDALLLLVGDGPSRPRLEEKVDALELGARIRLLDWQRFERVPSLIAASDVCLVPHEADPHTEATSPHKLFQYMLMGKPVVVSNCRPLKRIVETTGAGVVFESGSPMSLAAAVIALRDESRRRGLGEAGRAAVLDTYNWAHSSAALLRIYDELG